MKDVRPCMDGRDSSNALVVTDEDNNKAFQCVCLFLMRAVPKVDYWSSSLPLEISQ